MTEHVLEKLAATNPDAEIWWDSSPLIYPSWKDETLAKAPEGERANWETQLTRLYDDETIRARVIAEYRASSYVWCPHSATAAEAFARMSPEQQAERPWIACATAHPYKFADVVEPLIGATIAPPPALEAILTRETRKSEIPATLEALAEAIAEREPALT